MPLSVTHAAQTEGLGDLGGVQGVGQIRLVGEDQQDGVTEFVFAEHALEFLTGWVHKKYLYEPKEINWRYTILNIAPHVTYTHP